MRSKRRRPDDLPAMAPVRGSDVLRIKRLIGALQPLRLLEKPARSGRGIKEQHPSRLRTRVLPGVSEPALHEGTGAGTAHRNLVADLEGDLAGQHIGDLVTVVVQVIGRLRSDRCGFLKHHHALAGLPTQQLERRRSTRSHLPHPSLTGRYDKTFCFHRSILRFVHCKDADLIISSSVVPRRRSCRRRSRARRRSYNWTRPKPGTARRWRYPAPVRPGRAAPPIWTLRSGRSACCGPPTSRSLSRSAYR